VTSTTELPGAQPDLTPCHWGSVNQWECDENDHLNVRFYAHKVNQALAIMVAQITDTAPAEVARTIRSQHVRFLRESRAATPLRVDCGVVAAQPELLDVLSLLHDNVTGDLLAGVHTRLAVTVDAASHPPVTVPDAARPRGIDPVNLPTPPDGLEMALRAGFRIVGRGMIAAEECDAAGLLQPHHYVGRISDGMPNLWAFVNPPAERSARASGALGGAALEQRLDIRAPLAAGAVFTQLSGVRAIGGKTQQMAHVIYDETRERVAATMEAVGVAMDLDSRRAVAISDERRAHLERLLVR